VSHETLTCVYVLVRLCIILHINVSYLITRMYNVHSAGPSSDAELAAPCLQWTSGSSINTGRHSMIRSASSFHLHADYEMQGRNREREDVPGAAVAVCGGRKGVRRGPRAPFESLSLSPIEGSGVEWAAEYSGKQSCMAQPLVEHPPPSPASRFAQRSLSTMRSLRSRLDLHEGHYSPICMSRSCTQGNGSISVQCNIDRASV
jgi:hypothetical protein